jgi:benzoyl-CoA reductase/2-hydroxyglutaryl-CoA dehydratase subunit BcrC/BadD/HgdB
MTSAQESRWRREGLRVAAEAYSYHRAWFKSIQSRVAAGEPFAVISAETPLEILRALDIPVVMVQWWSSLIAAKQKSAQYLGYLRERGYPDDQEPYFSLALASVFDNDSSSAPWEGLPRPTFIIGDPRDDDQAKIYELWARESGAISFNYTRAQFNDAPLEWWALGANRWEELFEPAVLDLHVAQSEQLIELLERVTQRKFSLGRLRHVLDLVNEQESWFARARDLVARSVPSPISVTDTFTSVMMLQWHRGTEWGRDRAKDFYQEIEQRVQQRRPACADEQVRLQWIGTGLWFDVSFYDSFMASHSAVFVWSMYLALAADAYIRLDHGQPLRTLAARYVGFIQYLEMEPWPSAWYVKEALHHQIDGVVSLDGSPFIEAALQTAGIPVLKLTASNVDNRRWNELEMRRAVSEFIEGDVAAKARLRRAAPR